MSFCSVPSLHLNFFIFLRLIRYCKTTKDHLVYLFAYEAIFVAFLKRLIFHISDTICMGPSNEGWRSLCTSNTRMQLRDHVMISEHLPIIPKRQKVVEQTGFSVFYFLVYFRHTQCVFSLSFFFFWRASVQARCIYLDLFDTYASDLYHI